MAKVPRVSLREDTTICEGSNLVLEAMTSNTVDYQWSTGETSSKITISPDTATLYSVKIVNEGNCSDSAKVQIDVDPLPILEFIYFINDRNISFTNNHHIFYE